MRRCRINFSPFSLRYGYVLNCFLNLVDNDRHAEEFSWLLTLLWKSVRVYTEMKACFMLYKVVLLTLSVNAMLKCDHSNESYRAVLFCVTISCAVQGGSNV